MGARAWGREREARSLHAALIAGDLPARRTQARLQGLSSSRQAVLVGVRPGLCVPLTLQTGFFSRAPTVVCPPHGAVVVAKPNGSPTRRTICIREGANSAMEEHACPLCLAAPLLRGRHAPNLESLSALTAVKSWMSQSVNCSPRRPVNSCCSSELRARQWPSLLMRIHAPAWRPPRQSDRGLPKKHNKRKPNQPVVRYGATPVRCAGRGEGGAEGATPSPPSWG